MEKRKLLLVAVSVGVFLTIIISASILICAPKTSNEIPVSTGRPADLKTAGVAVSPPQPITAGTSGNPQVIPSETVPALPQPAAQPATVDAAEMVRNAGGIQSIQTPPNATAIQETNFYINGTQPAEGIIVKNSEGTSAAEVVVNIDRSAAVPNEISPPPAPARPRVQTETRTRAASPVQAESRARTPAASPKPAEKTVARPVSARPAAAQPKPAPKTHNDYWVQTGAFSAKINAEGVKETLSTKGITSIIDNHELEGKTLYRVRVGPYTSENEAKYWLALVKTIDGFADSQIRQSTSIR